MKNSTSILKSVFIFGILLFGLSACSENENCACLSDEIDYHKELKANGQIKLGPNLESKSCANLRPLVSDIPIRRWLEFCEQIKDCSRFEEYIKLTQAGLERLEMNK